MGGISLSSPSATPVDVGNVTGSASVPGVATGVVRVTLTGDATLTPSSPPAGGRWVLEVRQDATGGRKVTWSGVTWIAVPSAPPLSTSANGVSVFEFASPDGATVYGWPLNAPSDKAGVPFGTTTYLETMPKVMVSATPRGLTSGTAQLTHFTPDYDLACTKLAGMGAGTLATAATNTLGKFGIYEYTGSGNYTCRARTANDVNLFTANTGVFEKAIADDGAASPNTIAGLTLKAGTEYAFAMLLVGTSMPQVAGLVLGSNGQGNLGSVTAGGAAFYNGKRAAIQVSGQTDLPATLTAQNSATSTAVWGAMS